MTNDPPRSQAEETPTPIGIAVVEHAGHFLVGVRSDDGPLAGYAEFPGGKCLPDESPRDCAIRECQEETGLLVEPVELIFQTTFEYPHGTVDLNFWRCYLVDKRDVTNDHRGYRWVAVNALVDLRFPEANAPLLERLCVATGEL